MTTVAPVVMGALRAPQELSNNNWDTGPEDCTANDGRATVQRPQAAGQEKEQTTREKGLF